MEVDGAEALHGAATNGHVDILQWVRDRTWYCKNDFGVLIKAAEAGHLNVARWIIERDRDDPELGNESGDDEDEYDYDYGYYNSGGTRQKHITCLGGEASLAIHSAAINGHLDVAKYLFAHTDKPLDKDDEFEENRGLEKRIGAFSRWFGNSIAKVSGETMLQAAKKGFLDVVQWLYEEYHADPRINLFWVYKDDEAEYVSVVDVAAANGHLEIVKHLLQTENEDADSIEQRRKRRRTLMFANCPFGGRRHFTDEPMMPSCTKMAMNVTAAVGHLNVVQWLDANRTEGCTKDAMDFAALDGHLEIVLWLHSNRSEGCTTEAMNGAAGDGHLAIVKWLHEHRVEGCTSVAMDNAASDGHLEVVKWLHDNRSEVCSTAAMDGATAYGSLEVVQWLHRNRSEGCTSLAMDDAARGVHLKVLRWLFENRTEDFTAEAMYDAALSGEFEIVLILLNLAQEGLVPDIDQMSEDASAAWVGERYQEVVRAAVPKVRSV